MPHPLDHGDNEVGCNAGIRTPISGFRDQRPARWTTLQRDQVNLARFERAASTFARLRSCSAELQVQKSWLRRRDSNSHGNHSRRLSKPLPDHLGDASELQG